MARIIIIKLFSHRIINMKLINFKFILVLIVLMFITIYGTYLGFQTSDAASSASEIVDRLIDKCGESEITTEVSGSDGE
jgi:hypothetical protein